VLGIRGDMGLPQILEVVIVVDGTTPFHLGEDPAVS
jgi:hypothetical protein